jgi:hypothetical protein
MKSCEGESETGMRGIRRRDRGRSRDRDKREEEEG